MQGVLTQPYASAWRPTQLVVRITALMLLLLLHVTEPTSTTGAWTINTWNLDKTTVHVFHVQ
jgi:hypothetical protein